MIGYNAKSGIEINKKAKLKQVRFENGNKYDTDYIFDVVAEDSTPFGIFVHLKDNEGNLLFLNIEKVKIL